MEEFTFADKLALERRADKLAFREDSIIERLDKLFAKECLTPKRIAKIERLQDRLAAVRNDQVDVQDELISYANVTGEPDTYEFGGFEYSKLTAANGNVFDFGKASIAITDSDTDDTYQAGDNIRVQAVASKRFGGAGSTFTADAGVTEGNVTTFTFGSSTLGEFAVGYDTLAFKVIDESNNTIFVSDTIDVTNIV